MPSIPVLCNALMQKIMSRSQAEKIRRLLGLSGPDSYKLDCPYYLWHRQLLGASRTLSSRNAVIIELSRIWHPKMQRSATIASKSASKSTINPTGNRNIWEQYTGTHAGRNITPSSLMLIKLTHKSLTWLRPSHFMYWTSTCRPIEQFGPRNISF